MLAFGVAFAVSAFACYLILRSAGWHLSFTADRPGDGPQKFHTEPTPRIGGLAIFAGILAASLIADPVGGDPVRYWFLLLSLLPAFLGGFVEDITRRIPPLPRLLLTVVTAGFAYALVDVRFFRSGVEWLDLAFTFAPLAYLGLMLAVAGVAHAMNIIDGYNGLSGGVGTIILLALATVAAHHGDAFVAGICMTTAGALCGFLLFNYPLGRVFQGDGGAYLQGCVIALAAAMLVQRNPDVSPWFPFLLVLYPIWETLFSMLRRLTIHGSKIGEPDARHLHTLVFRRLAHRWIERRDATGTMLQNAITTLPFLVVSALLAVFAVMSSDSTRTLQTAAAVFVAVYTVTYLQLSRLKRPITRAVAAYLMRRRVREASRPVVRVPRGQDGLAGNSGSTRGGSTR